MGQLPPGLANWLKTHKRPTGGRKSASAGSPKMPMINGKPAWLSKKNKKKK